MVLRWQEPASKTQKIKMGLSLFILTQIYKVASTELGIAY